MAHDHTHHHHAPEQLTHVGRAFIIGIVLNLLFVVIEAVIGLNIHSLSLLSDAGHNLADVGSLAISLLAFRAMKVKANEQYTYGYRKTSILAALFNAVLLLVSIGAICYEAVMRFAHPAPLPGKTIAIVAGIGIIINGASGLLFLKNKESDINIKAAYLHLMSDAVVSAGIVVAGIVIFFTDWFWLDPVISLAIAVTILISTWQLLKDSVRLSLDGVPAGIKLDDIYSAARNIDGIERIHHVHVWAMSSTENAMTGHLVISDLLDSVKIEQLKEAFRHELLHLKISHATLETEFVHE